MGSRNVRDPHGVLREFGVAFRRNSQANYQPHLAAGGPFRLGPTPVLSREVPAQEADHCATRGGFLQSCRKRENLGGFLLCYPTREDPSSPPFANLRVKPQARIRLNGN